jgi:ribosome-binding protein aMBF1 (putative translation factor)
MSNVCYKCGTAREGELGDRCGAEQSFGFWDGHDLDDNPIGGVRAMSCAGILVDEAVAAQERIGQTVRDNRTRKGMSLSKAAGLLSVSVVELSSIERDTIPPNSFLLERLRNLELI